VKETIIIKNFAGIQYLKIDLSAVNVIIGPQASGKSVTVKLLYFFKSFFQEIFKSVDLGETKRDLDRRQVEKFNNYFPKEAWPKNGFSIHYIINNSHIIINKDSTSPLSFDYSENIKELLKKCKKFYNAERKKVEQDPKVPVVRVSRNANEKYIECVQSEISQFASFNQLFIPAGRSFYANVQSGIFSFLSDNKSLDPFLIEFGAFYENFKRISYNEFNQLSQKKKLEAFDELISSILNGRYSREKEKDYLVHLDNRKVNLSNASSGQQETLPLLIILKTLSMIRFSGKGATLYIEEPEAHLFPTAQKKIVQLLARVFNLRDYGFQIIITTHSPYILAAFNNLIQAGKLKDNQEINNNDLFEIIPEQEIISPDCILAYSMKNGEIEILIDNSTQLISQNILDSVSDEIAIEFGQLLDLEFGT